MSSSRAVAAAAYAAVVIWPGVASAGPVEYLGSAFLPRGMAFEDSIVGGLSGLAWGADAGWYAISDDRAERGPARAYELRPVLRDGRLERVEITGLVGLETIAGQPFQPPARDPAYDTGAFADPESVAWDPGDRTLYWTSEGSWPGNIDARLWQSRPDGRALRVLPLPPVLRQEAGHSTGPRDNADLEAMTLVPGGTGLWLGTERPLVQDGNLPTLEQGAPVRLTLMDRHSARVQRQVAYPLSPRITPPEARDDTPALSEIAALDATRLLTLERSYAEGLGTWVQLYLADTRPATDVAALPALAGAGYRPVAKRLLLDLRAAGLPMDNYEGMALGPALPDGRRLLLICSDDNFGTAQKTIFLAFAVDVSALLR